MAWRFKASKYKNAAPIVPKPEACIRDISVGSYQTYGNNICASAAFMAFNWEHVGSSMAVLPLDDCGRKSKTMPLLHAHSDTITDMEFSPFHDGLLLTGSQDSLVSIFKILNIQVLDKFSEKFTANIYFIKLRLGIGIILDIYHFDNLSNILKYNVKKLSRFYSKNICTSRTCLIQKKRIV